MEIQKRLVERAVVALERNATASEELIRLATEERDSGDSIFGPPICPHCGTFDPKIENQGGDGQMAEFVLVAQCKGCGERFFGVAQGWLVFHTAPEAMAYLSERGGKK